MAFTVTYNGNGSDGGSVPVDAASYNAGATVTLQPIGSLTRTAATFAYWTTSADGTGSIFGWPVATTFPMPAANVTLFAQWFVSTGLKNNATTAHYTLSYDGSLAPSGLEPTRTNALIDAVEGDFTWMGNQFAGVTIGGTPVKVFVTRLTGGANNTGDIRLKPNDSTVANLRAYLVSEITETFMNYQQKGWGFLPGVNNEESCGEGLSLFLTQQFEIVNAIAGPYTAFTADNWLNSSLPASNPASKRFLTNPDGSITDFGIRADYLNSVLPYPGNGPGTGCSILFIYYLFHQLGFTIPQIIAAAPGYKNGVLNATAPLRGVYQNLTGDVNDPYPFFRRLVDAAFPADKVSSIGGALPDDPYPLGLTSFIVDKNTFGLDEVKDVLKTSGGTWSKAFWIAVEGFSKNAFGTLGISVAPFTGNLSTIPGLTITQNPAIDYVSGASPQTPQIIRIPFDVTFTNASLASFPATDSQLFELDASLNSPAGKVLGSSSSTLFELVSGADPYFTNVDPSQDNVFYLSQDVRVFTGTPSETNLPIAGGPSFSSDSPAGAYAYIQALLTFLNTNFSDPNASDPFNTILPSQMGALTGDSSVTPYDNVEDTLHNNYNFAVARVRLRGTAGPLGAAKGVRVFFRLWTTQTADTDFQDATYPSFKDGSGNPTSPQLAPDIHTIPFFATGDLSANTDYTPTGPNLRTITIPAGADSVWAYFGCFFNLYDPANIINGKAAQAWLNGTHHCLVAQIAFAGAPVIAGASPERSDKLAQRNLSFVASDNPGPPDSHRVPQTFDIRPSDPNPAPGLGAFPFDELMIDWGAVPPGTSAYVYWPQAQSSAILALAASRSTAHGLTASDANTIRCNVTGGVTYLPIPPQTGPNLAGLITLDLPTTVTTGQQFQVVVRRIGTQLGTPIVPPEVPHIAAAIPADAPAGTFTYRYVVGSFQVTIPVSTPDALLNPEQDVLAIMKWRLTQTPPTSRWYPVLLRYLDVIAARVDALGGDSSAVPPSPKGFPPQPVVTVAITFPPTGNLFVPGEPIEVRGNATWTPTPPGVVPVTSMQLSAWESRFNGFDFDRFLHVNDFPLTLTPSGAGALSWQHTVVPFDGQSQYELRAFAFDASNNRIASSDRVFIRSV